MSLKDYFTYLPGQAQCKTGACTKKINRNDGNTTGMRNHLREDHPDKWKKFVEQQKKPTTPKAPGIDRFFEPTANQSTKRQAENSSFLSSLLRRTIWHRTQLSRTSKSR